MRVAVVVLTCIPHTTPGQEVSFTLTVFLMCSAVKRGRSHGQRGGLCLMGGVSSTSEVKTTRQVRVCCDE